MGPLRRMFAPRRWLAPSVSEWALFVAYGDLYVWCVVLGGRGHRIAWAIG